MIKNATKMDLGNYLELAPIPLGTLLAYNLHLVPFQTQTPPFQQAMALCRILMTCSLMSSSTGVYVQLLLPMSSVTACIWIPCHHMTHSDPACVLDNCTQPQCIWSLKPHMDQGQTPWGILQVCTCCGHCTAPGQMQTRPHCRQLCSACLRRGTHLLTVCHMWRG